MMDLEIDAVLQEAQDQGLFESLVVRRNPAGGNFSAHFRTSINGTYVRTEASRAVDAVRLAVQTAIDTGPDMEDII